MSENGRIGEKGGGRLPCCLVLAVLGGLFAMACGASPDGASPEERAAIRIGSFDFAESELVAELYAQVLEAADLPVARLGVVGPREIVAPALEGGLLDVVPEYTGTAARHYGFEHVVDDPTAVEEALGERGLVLLEPAPAENVNVVVVTADAASTHELSAISDLSSWPGPLRLGGPAECSARPLCLIGLVEVYELEFAEFIPQRTLAVTADALVRGEIEVGVMFSTAAELLSEPLVVLDDDRGLQPHEYVAPLVRADAVARWGPTFVDALDGLAEVLTTEELRRLNQAVADGTPLSVAVGIWLRTSGAPS